MTRTIVLCVQIVSPQVSPYIKIAANRWSSHNYCSIRCCYAVITMYTCLENGQVSLRGWKITQRASASAYRCYNKPQSRCPRRNYCLFKQPPRHTMIDHVVDADLSDLAALLYIPKRALTISTPPHIMFIISVPRVVNSNSMNHLPLTANTIYKHHQSFISLV